MTAEPIEIIEVDLAGSPKAVGKPGTVRREVPYERLEPGQACIVGKQHGFKFQTVRAAVSAHALATDKKFGTSILDDQLTIWRIR